MDRIRTIAVGLISAGIAGTPVVAAESATGPAEGAVTPEELLAGHSVHGESFNEGPRQAAYLMKGMPDVHFAVTTTNTLCQQFFDQGMGQLYGFWSLEAERSFRQAAVLDPECAMAYWGMAMATLSNAERVRGFVDEAVKRKGKASPREVRYINALDKFVPQSAPTKKDDEEKAKEALSDAEQKKAEEKKKAAEAKAKEEKKKRAAAFVRALEDIVVDFPDDLNAKALMVVQYWKNEKLGIQIQSHFALDSVLAQIFAEAPMHPAHHFAIHVWDRRRAEQALASAAACGQTSPGIAHMWHMPGHIYSKRNRLHDAAWHQEASARVDHAHMMRDGVMPDQIHNFAHNNEWLCRNLLQVGRVHDAVALAENMIGLPRHPKYNTMEKRGSATYGRMRLAGALEQYELWEALVEACESGLIEAPPKEKEARKHQHLLGVAYALSGKHARAATVIEGFETKLAAAKPEGEKTDEKQEKAFQTLKKELDPLLAELRAWQHLAEDEFDAAKKQLALAKSMDKFRLAQARLACGETNEVVKLARKMIEKKEQPVLPLARAAWLLDAGGETKAADQAFARLREISSTIDLDVPVFKRLAPLAQRAGLAADWRVPLAVPEDIGVRPDLDSLGPFRWQPVTAPPWSLVDADGKTRSLAAYRGKPVIVFFYLGFGCLHCVEQLQAFAPEMDAFREAGIQLVGVSTSPLDELQSDLAEFEEEEDAIPFTLVADGELGVFKAYRVFDDFEQSALHGTFLIDSEGKIRWQDISYEPFSDVAFLLQEAKRLLK